MDANRYDGMLHFRSAVTHTEVGRQKAFMDGNRLKFTTGNSNALRLKLLATGNRNLVFVSQPPYSIDDREDL